MSYGKPDTGADIGGWRARANTREMGQRAARSFKPYVGSRFANIFKPQKGSERIRLIPGNYKVPNAITLKDGTKGVAYSNSPYLEVVDHYDGRTGTSCICSGGPLGFSKAQALPCVACKVHYSAERDADGRRNSRFSRRTTNVFNVLVYGKFVKVEQMDANGIVKCSAKTGKPYTEWVRYSNNLTNILEEKDGHVMHWAANYTQYNLIKAYDSLIGKSCIACGGVQTITRDLLICKKCAEVVVACGNTDIKVESQDNMLIEDVHCPSCRHCGPLEEYIVCSASTCKTPKRATVFDVDITLNKLEDQGQTQLIIEGYSAPFAVDVHYKATPMDLTAMYAPDSVEVQEKKFGITYEDAAAGKYANDTGEDPGPQQRSPRTRPYNNTP
jgi:hypothetical protein